MLRPYSIGTFDKDRTRAARRRRDALRRLALRPAIEGMEARIAPATRVWSGAVDTLWSTPGNWDAPPEAGDDLVFPNDATGFTSSNDLLPGTSFKSITISGSGYTLSGNAVGLTDGLSATYTSGTSADGIATDLGAGAVSVAAGGTLLLSGSLGGAAGLTLTGGGTLALSAANTYSGPTAVNAGALRVDGSIPGAVNLAPGTTLSGIGATGAVTSAGATILPGNAAPGTLQVASAVIDAASTFSARLDGNTPGDGPNHYDRLSTPGGVTLDNAMLSLSLGGGYTPTAGDALVLIDNTGADPVDGTFNGLPEGALLTLGAGKTFRITYQGGTGNDVVLNFVQDSTTALTSSANPSVFGQPITFTATVTAATGTPTGTVTFMDGAAALGTGTLDASGQATYTGTLGVGTHFITAVYNGDPSNNPSTSDSVVQAVAQADTATTVVAAPNPSVFGQAVTFTATVTALPPGAGVPTGTVSFFDGAVLLGTAAVDASGQAAFTTSALGAGTHPVTAVYSGDADFTGSTAPISVQFVNQAATTTAVTAVPSPTVFGQAVTFTATATAVAPGAGIPTGTVSFFVGATLLGTGTLDATGQASLTTSALVVGTHFITAVYDGDAGFTGSTSPVDTHVVGQAPTATTVAAPTPSTFGQAITITATVTALAPGAGVPTGTVSFFDGVTPLGVAALDASGQASLTTATLSPGAHAVTAVYGGDAGFAGNTAPVFTQVVNLASVQVTVVGSPSPSALGQPVTFTAAVAVAAPGAGVPTGVVFFLDGAAMLGVAALNASGQATLTTSALSFGNHAITAVYGGDAGFQGNTTPAFTQAVGSAATTTSLTGSVNPTVFGQAVTFTAVVSPTAAVPDTPTGTVAFYDGATLLGSANLDATGTAAFTTSALPVGGHSITAVYGGDVFFQPSTSPVWVQGVNRVATAATIDGSGSPTLFGQPVTVTTTVSASAPGSGVPTGTVQLLDGATVIATATLDGAGAATFVVTTLSVGSHSLSIAYAGDTGFNPAASSTLVQQINQASTGTVLTASSPTTVLGETLTVTATVTPVDPAGGVPTGTVAFYNGATLVDTVPLDASGVARLTWPLRGVIPLFPGTYSITAVYSGDPGFSGSTSPALTHTVKNIDTYGYISTTTPSPVVGQPVTFVFKAGAVAPGRGTPDGHVYFYDGATEIGSARLSGGTAVFTTTSLSVGSHSIKGVYNGGDYIIDPPFFNPVTSEPISLTVSKAPTGMGSLDAPLHWTVFGQWMAFTATVSTWPQPGVVPTGPVTFYDGATPLATVTPVGGVATYVATSLPVGNHVISAVYGGDAKTFGSRSSNFYMNVAKNNAVVTVTAGDAVAGQPTLVTATLSAAAPGAGKPTGVVYFLDNNVVVGSAWVVNGAAQARLNLAPVGSTHTLTVAYPGDDHYNPTFSNTLVRTVAPAGTTTALFAIPAQNSRGTWLVAAVTPSTPGAGAATGTVTFFVNGAAFSARTLANGTASVYLGSTGVNRVYAARYNGSPSLRPSTSPPVILGTGALRASARPMAALAARGAIKANGRHGSLGL